MLQLFDGEAVRSLTTELQHSLSDGGRRQPIEQVAFLEL